MDPLSILAIAAAVTQFVDYGTRVLKDTREIVKTVSGQTTKNIELSSIAQDLAALSNEISTRAQKIVNGDGPNSELIFVRLCEECQDIAVELQTSLSQLRAKGTTRIEFAASSLAVALKGVWSSGSLTSLHERLGQVRQQMMMAVLTFLWYEPD
jgi:hypothetical protein